MGIDSKGHELWNDLNFRFLKFFLATGAGAANYSPAPPATYATVAARFSSGKKEGRPEKPPFIPFVPTETDTATFWQGRGLHSRDRARRIH